MLPDMGESFIGKHDVINTRGLPLQPMKHLSVKLSTASGCVYSGRVSSLDVRTIDGSVHVNSSEESFLNMIHATELTVQTAAGPLVFALENAVASLKGRSFTVLAQSLRLIEPEAIG